MQAAAAAMSSTLVVGYQEIAVIVDDGRFVDKGDGHGHVDDDGGGLPRVLSSRVVMVASTTVVVGRHC